MTKQFKILTVCTGNVCRSPQAEILLKDALPAEEIYVASAGTQALVGSHMPAMAQEAIGKANSDQHVGRQLTPEMIERSDLILGMAREHRRAVVELCPRARKRTFTLRELAMLVEVTPDRYVAEALNASPDAREKMISAIEAVRLSKNLLTTSLADEDLDIIDPYGATRDVYNTSYHQVAKATAAVASLLQRAAE
ncbi:low molecular weight phosphatase family protein [Corynebacterium sp. zg912]|uniref:Low molecular weight phosphatase family protein n=1 Tax=Corynebacterium wankanglinii TaxID=2735136 RepID=A0A7H0K9B9_9CORY|nr:MULTISPECIES: low molecular weight phosphatase family protein [Corynebacterium]MBA1838398.1 low molecular weight phosphatase family protein [Corynebacterium wankanglinii]MCR5929911.1 low molecular weight phosphatase family protein [Corynebacterium sp. zg912]QNP93885.1 low molecular weight phosphatase family protein [Corynebacterium wankanglinii]